MRENVGKIETIVANNKESIFPIIVCVIGLILIVATVLLWIATPFLVFLPRLVFGEF
jgi:hypothetical protein